MEPANGADGTISNLAMPRLSPAFKRLEERLAEVSHLHLVARKYAQMKKIIKHKDQVAHTNALVRSATVLLSSHIQGYVEDLSDIVIEHLIADDVDAVLVPDTASARARPWPISLPRGRRVHRQAKHERGLSERASLAANSKRAGQPRLASRISRLC